MTDTHRETPILLIIFNRPDKVKVLMDSLSKIKPAYLYISADGPRMHVLGEKERCEEARKIAQIVPWPCKITTHFSENNLGCKVGVSSAINWFFSQVEEGIILEDDCIPEPTFFPFCTELLARYRFNEHIMHIGGTTFLDQSETSIPLDSYHFSQISHIWGWATWKRAWMLYDIETKNINHLSKKITSNKIFLKNSYIKFWINLFKHVRDKKIDTWDAQWLYSVMLNNGLAITPHTNLIKNIGFDGDATHTKSKNTDIKPVNPINIPLSHPENIEVDYIADAKLMEKIYVKNLKKKIIERIILFFS